MRWLKGLVAISSALLLVNTLSLAQGWPPWGDAAGQRTPDSMRPLWPQERDGDFRDAEPPRSRFGGTIRDGGARPEIAPQAPTIVAFAHNFPSNSIVIDTGARKLYFVLPESRAYAYPISVGREGFNWAGSETVSRKQAWPDWYPPAEMRERDPSLPERMTGGLKNPLGAMALYLGNTLYRIHGTNDAKSIGRAQSSGCFRMLNSAVMHLASIAEIGTPVTVVPSLPAALEVSRAADPTTPAMPQPLPGLRHAAPRPADDGRERTPDYRALRDLTLSRP
jgi:lipoprotein-anchoring transpeptidase ErfK/SrfK